MKKLKPLFGLLCWVTWQLSSAQLVINEYSCSNYNDYADQFGDYEDWIELYNPSGAPVSTAGLFLSDNPANPLKWPIPTTNVPAGGHLLVFASDLNITNSPPYHTSFKLRQSENPESIVLSDVMGTPIDQVSIQKAARNHSAGRSTDGAATWAVFSNPTPNASNTGAFTNYMPPVTVSVPRGFYTANQSVALACTDPSAEIRYTLNGAEPTPTSNLYTGPIAINATTVLRARAFPTVAGFLPGWVSTNTYFINESFSLPVVSLSSTDYNAIFANGNLRIFSHLEYFSAGQQFLFESYGEVNKHGNDSWAFPQKGIDFITKDECGYDQEMNYPIFHTSSRPDYQRIMFKAGASDNYPFTWGNGGCHLRDAFVQSLAEKIGMNLDLRRLEHCIVFINGNYWGIYECREKVNDPDYTKFYHGQEKKDLDFLSYWGSLNVRYGSPADWNNLYNYVTSNSMQVQANYQTVASQMDLNNVIDYMIINTWSVNSDWLNWNTMWWKGNGGNGVPWRYALWDQDNIFNLGHNYTGLPTTGFNADPCEYDDMFPNSGPNIGHMVIFSKLMENPGFKAAYLNRYQQLSTGGLSCPYVLTHLDSIINILSVEMPKHINRWGGSMNEWQTNLQFLRDQITGRCQVIEQGLEDCYDVDGPHPVVINVWPPNSGDVNFNGVQQANYPWTQSWFGNLQANMSATAKVGWNFSHWELFNHSLTPDSTVNPASFLLLQADSIVAIFVRTDSLTLTYDVSPPLSGSIRSNGTVIPVYPLTQTQLAGNVLNLEALPVAGYLFDYWEIFHHSLSPDSSAAQSMLTFGETDTLIAHFVREPDNPIDPPPPPSNMEDEALWLPNAFTANGDGLNEVFKVYHNGTITEGTFSIFDRWGELLFTAKNLNQWWDGNYMNQPCMEGVYTVAVRYYNAKEKRWKTRVANVNLIR